MQAFEKALARTHLNLPPMPRFSPVRVVRPVPGALSASYSGATLSARRLMPVRASNFQGQAYTGVLQEVIREPVDVRSHAKHSPGIAALERGPGHRVEGGHCHS